jgi:phosphoglycolate phosphatase-like HAD superfamily hydrolase
MNKFEIPKTYISKNKAEKEVGAMQKIMRERRKITEPLKASTLDYREAYEKMGQDKKTNQTEKLVVTEAKEVQELFDAVLFDWDGVLYDSMETLATAAIEVCREFGVIIDKEKFLETYDQPYREWYKKLGIPADNEAAHKYIRYLYNNEIKPRLQAQKPDKLFPDVVATLKELKQRGISIGIVSAERGENIRKVLDENEMSDLPDYIFDRADNKNEAIIRICQENGFIPDRVLMVGDLPSDLRDARKAGVKAAGIARRDNDRDRLGSFDPDYLLGGLGNEITILSTYEDKNYE